MTDIPAPQSATPDIYSYGYDKDLNKVTDPGTDISSPTVYDTIDNAINAGQVLSGGNLTLKTVSVGNLVKQVAIGDDIQAAIDAVNREGGGTVQLLTGTYLVNNNLQLKSNVILQGSGKDLTNIDFRTQSFNISSQGSITSTINSVTNVGLKNLTVLNSSGVAGVFMYLTNFFTMDNVKVKGCTQNGVKIDSCRNWSIKDCQSSNNTSVGFIFTSVSNNNSTQDFIVSNCLASSNTSHGFQATLGNVGSANVQRWVLLGCISTSNGGRGFSIDTNGLVASVYGSINGCVANSNTSQGIFLANNVSALTITGCQSNSNTSDGIKVLGQSCSVTGNVATSNGGYDLYINGLDIIYHGNITSRGISTAPNTNIFITTNFATQALNNSSNSPGTEAQTYQVLNQAGVTLRSGMVVIWGTNNQDLTVKTTTTNGDNKVFGVIPTSISSSQYGAVQVRGINLGGVSGVWVKNGASSITAGDWLSTYSEAYYAKKAVAGETVFAIALSTPSTSTAQIDAILVSPRLI